MDTPQKPSPLPSIRTFAKDLEKKQATTPVGETPVATPGKPIPEATMVAGEGHVYQAPTWKKRQTGPTDLPKPPMAKKPRPEEPKKIPEPTLRPLSSPKAASEPTIIVDNEDAASATIIRDTKHNRFRLFPAIGSSLKLWFSGLKEKYFTKKAPKYTVPETTLRKGVIQKATSKTGKIATFDHTSLQERIRERRDRVAPKTPTTTWSPNTEPGFLLLEEGDTAITNVHVEPRKSFRTPLQAPVPPPAPVEPTPVPPPAPAPLPETEPEPVPAVVETAPLPEPPVTPPPTPVEPTPTLASPVPLTSPVTTTRLRDWLFAMNTNVMSLGVTGLVLALITIGAIGFVWFRGQIETTELVQKLDHPSLLQAPLQLTYVETLTAEGLRSHIATELATFEGTTQLGIAASKDLSVLLPTPAILEILGFDVSAVFGRSIATLYFGKLASGAPFIVMKTTDLTTARGGMLAWEGTLFEDVQPLLTPATAANASTGGATYTDVVVGKSDARLLADESGKEYLVYSLTKDTMVIITTTTSALTELLTITN